MDTFKATSHGWNENQRRLIGTTISMMVLSTLTFILRVVSRWKSAAPFGWDDTCAFVALAVSFGPNLAVATAVHYGLGRHVSEVSASNAHTALILAWVEHFTWQIATTFVKLSFLFFYRRLFPVRGIRTACTIVGAFVLCWIVTCFILFLNACTPLRYNWDRSIPGGHCLNYDLFYIITAALNTTADIITFAIPLPVVWNLKMSQTKKIGLSIVFLIGGFACVASIIRMAYLHTLSPVDITWTGTNVGLWGAIEVSAGVIACNIPATTPLFLNMVNKTFRSKKPESSNTAGYAFSNTQRERYVKYGNSKKKKSSKNWFSQGFTTIDDDFEMTGDTVKMTTTINADSKSEQELPTHGIKVRSGFEQVSVSNEGDPTV